MTNSRLAAEDELRALGFSRNADGDWVRLGGGTPILRVRIPEDFPFALPTVLTDRATLTEAVPHIERSGRVCVATNAGLLLDPSRPRALVREVIKRGEDILKSRSSDQNRNALLEEFSAYWGEGDAVEILSFCAPLLEPRPIAVGTLRVPRPHIDMVVADSRQQLQSHAQRCGVTVGKIERGFIVPLIAPIVPPRFEYTYRVSDLRLILDHVAPSIRAELLKQRGLSGTRLVLLFGFAVPDVLDSQIWFALRLGQPMEMTPGFRNSKARLSAAIKRHPNLKFRRTNVQRADSAFLARRIGAQADLSSFRVGIVGCGAIGGFVALSLAAAGVAKITLIDDDALRTDNVMRHALGVSDVGLPKATALRAELWRRLPHIEIEAYTGRVQTLMAAKPEVVLDNDLLVLATGDHNLELYISSQLRTDVRLVHVWVEALGVGGHVLLDAQRGRGCLQCLYDVDADLGVICRPSLFAPQQSFTSQLAGCAGAFTPFGVVDSQGIAIEATRLALRALTKNAAGSVLVTRYDSDTPFMSGQYQPSARALRIPVGSRVEIIDHATGCLRCAT